MSETGWYYKGQYLTNDIAKDLIALGFPVERKIEGEIKMKYQEVDLQEGDLVTIRLDKGQCIDLKHGSTVFGIKQIVKHEQKPFDWKDVKPGMAFVHKMYGSVQIYIGPHISRHGIGEYSFYFYDKELKDCVHWLGNDLIRSPEHDIEVQS